MLDSPDKAPGPQRLNRLAGVRPRGLDARFSLSALSAAVTTCCVLLAFARLAPAAFWESAARVVFLLMLLSAMAAVILVASLLFIAAVVGGVIGLAMLLRTALISAAPAAQTREAQA